MTRTAVQKLRQVPALCCACGGTRTMAPIGMEAYPARWGAEGKPVAVQLRQDSLGSWLLLIAAWVRPEGLRGLLDSILDEVRRGLLAGPVACWDYYLMKEAN